MQETIYTYYVQYSCTSFGLVGVDDDIDSFYNKQFYLENFYFDTPDCTGSVAHHVYIKVGDCLKTSNSYQKYSISYNYPYFKIVFTEYSYVQCSQKIAQPKDSSFTITDYNDECVMKDDFKSVQAVVSFSTSPPQIIFGLIYTQYRTQDSSKVLFGAIGQRVPPCSPDAYGCFYYRYLCKDDLVEEQIYSDEKCDTAAEGYGSTTIDIKIDNDPFIDSNLLGTASYACTNLVRSTLLPPFACASNWGTTFKSPSIDISVPVDFDT